MRRVVLALFLACLVGGCSLPGSVAAPGSGAPSAGGTGAGQASFPLATAPVAATSPSSISPGATPPSLAPGATSPSLAPGATPPAPAPGTASPEAATPTSSAAPAPSSEPTAPPVPAQRSAARFGYAAKGMSGEVMAFVESGEIAEALRDLDLSVVSTVAFFSLTPDARGDLSERGAAWRAWVSPEMSALIAKAHAAGTRVVLSLGRFSWSPAEEAVSDAILASASRRAHLARQVAAEVARRGVDGVNVDFEPIPPGRAAAFTDFVRRLRWALDALGPGYQLTVAITGHYDTYDVASLVAPGAADALYLMGYEYAGSWSTVAFSTDPYGGPHYDVAETVSSLLRLVRPDQLIVGVPYYGHLWPTASAALNARTLGGGEDVPYAQAVALGAAHGVRHDAVEHTAWSAWQEVPCPGCAPQWVQLYLDDATTLTWKWRYLVHRRLLGTGIWRIAYEGAPGALDAALRETFLKPLPAPEERRF